MTTDTIDTHAALVAQIQADGFQPGAPVSVPRAHIDIDREVAGNMRCACCRQRGMIYDPFHCGTRYAAIAWCPACLFAEEM